MNKLVATMAALLMPLSAFACWHPYYEPEGFITYRVSDEYWHFEGHRYGRAARFSEITDSLARITSTPEEREVLAFAKLVERERQTLIDPWHYCYRGDTLVVRLDSLSQVAVKRTNGPQGDRYMIQAVRTLASLHRYEEIINLWQRYTWRDERLRLLVEGHLAGAYYHSGQYEEALEWYRHCYDIEGMELCLRRMGREDVDGAIFAELVSNGSPYSYDYVASTLQRAVWNCENADSLARRCHTLARSCHRQFLPLMRYTEAYLLYECGRYQAALDVILLAQDKKADPLLQNSISTLRVMIEAETRPYDDDYLLWLDRQSRWLIGQASKYRGRKERRWVEDPYTGEWEETYDFVLDEPYNLLSCREIHVSSNYHADMLHRIVDCSVVPKMLTVGDTLHAIQMLDVVDYCCMADSTKIKLNDHGCASLCFAYERNVEVLQRLLNAYNDCIGRLWEEHGSGKHKDKWIELVGTRLLLDGRYALAEKYLRLVSGKYLEADKYRPNDCFWEDKMYGYEPTVMRDPFALEYASGNRPNDSTVYTKLHPDYKLRFARKMASLQRQMHSLDADVRGEATILYGVGMHNSASACWWLTQYGVGESPFFPYHMPGVTKEKKSLCVTTIANRFLCEDYDYHEYPDYEYHEMPRTHQHRDALLARSRQYIEQGAATMHDHERLAAMMWRMGYYRTVKYRLANTQLAQTKQGECDRWDFW